MELVLERDSFSQSAVLGVLYVNGVSFCDTLEPAFIKGYGKRSCIKPGTYSIDYHYSPKYGKYMLTLCGVDGRSGILIHSGNTSLDTSGCILVGVRKGNCSLVSSRSTLGILLKRVFAAMCSSSVTITIRNK